ncbi:hypothetical protein HT031_005232 [Scenedesmus sp. PABB004]|nr:hypothetical protein HT031_005232 [Scenedesmus sp. PABB004]
MLTMPLRAGLGPREFAPALRLSPAARRRASHRRGAFRSPDDLPPATTPEERTLQSLVETGVRGSIAMAAAYALHLSIFSHVRLDAGDALLGLQAAAPALAMEAALLAAAAALPPAAAAAEAVEGVYLHTLRYSLLGAAPRGTRLLLEAAAQLSDDLLARGVLLGCSAAWLSSRLMEAGLCGEPGPGAALLSSSAPAALCGSGGSVAAAVGLCAMMAARYSAHAARSAASLSGAAEAAAADAAARAALLRYEPRAVQDAAAAAAPAAPAPGGGAAREQLVSRLLHGWLGARFIVGQAGMFGAYIATDNLLASFVAGLTMQAAANAACEAHLARRA